MATYGMMPNMILYLMNEYHMGMSTASTVLFLWSAATNITPLLGAIVADSFLGRFYTIGVGSIICLMVMHFSLKFLVLANWFCLKPYGFTYCSSVL